MITVKALYDSGKGSIVDYLLDSVSDGAGDVRAASPATRYYTEAGTPPGRWVGSGLAGLGAGDVRVGAGEQVDGDQLRALIADGRDPLTGEQLGRAFTRQVSAGERVARRVARLSGDLSGAERSAAVEAITVEERSRKTGPRAVHGFDFTFAPAKSVSVLWALGDAGVREQVLAAHHAAIERTLAIMERDVVRTRTGSQGVVQSSTRGLVAAAFDHWDSRDGDPHLHTHVVIANSVQGADGRWRTLDSRGALLPAVVAMSETYDNLVMDELASRLQVGWVPGRRHRGKAAVWEVDGVGADLLTEFSRRRSAIELARGDAPTRAKDAAAWSATRTVKTHRALADLTASWQERAAQLLGRRGHEVRRVLRGVLGRPVGTPRPGRPGGRAASVDAADVYGQMLQDLADAALEGLSQSRAHWSDWNVRAEVERVTRPIRTTSPTERDRLCRRVVEAVEAASVRLDLPDLTHTPAQFTRPDGSSMFRPERAATWTTAAMLAAEDRILAAGSALDGPGLDPAAAADLLVGWMSPGGQTLAEDQAAAAYAVLTSGRVADVLVGPAGAGKTTTLAAVRAAWEATHGAGTVRGLAPSAAAADVLAGSLGIPTENLDKWLHETARAGSDDAARWVLHRGDLMVIDEASMAATLPLDQILTQARRAGAKVLLVGDPAQLSAVGAGGGFGMLTRARSDAPELLGVRRFAQVWEASATLRLRVGDPSVVDVYTRHERVHTATTADVVDQVYAAWAADRAAGLTSVMIAPDNTTATDLSMRARADLVSAGHVTADGVDLAGGAVAGTGDQIVTRRNDRHLTHGRTWVKNGSTYDVVRANGDGSLLVRPAGGDGHLTLPAAYVREHVDLAYATTAHRAQGATVDTAHAVVTSRTSRELLYVAMSRGRHANHAHVVVDEDGEFPTGETPPTAREVLEGALRTTTAPLAAREEITRLAEDAGSIARLAAEYETLARAGRARAASDHLTEAGLPEDVVDQVTAGETFDTLVSVLHRAGLHDLPVASALPGLLAAAPLHPTTPGADLTDRVVAWYHQVRPVRPARRDLIAGLVPRQRPTGDTDLDQALADRAQAIEDRADALVDRALTGNEPSWADTLPPVPQEPRARRAWLTAARTVAAYRDRYQITGPLPLGGDPGPGWTRREDHRRALAAVRTMSRAGESAPTVSSHPAGPAAAPVVTPDV